MNFLHPGKLGTLMLVNVMLVNELSLGWEVGEELLWSDWIFLPKVQFGSLSPRWDTVGGKA